jgi:uncharacterized protein
MPPGIAYAFNRTRETFLVTELCVADTHWTRLKGLLGKSRASFWAGKGLWIVPCHGVHTFAMSFPIDVVYLDENNTIVHIEENVKPWRVTPLRMEASTVLELPARTVWSTSTKIGDRVEIQLERETTASAAD